MALPRGACVWIAEKPSLAETIAKSLGRVVGQAPCKRGDHWAVGGEHRVVWLFGHLFELAPPDVYDPDLKQWRLERLPIPEPKKWKRVPSGDKAAHFKKLIEHFRWAKYFVNCGDAGREGQLLVDEVLEEAKIDPFGNNVFRLWLQSMADHDVDSAVRSIFPNRKKLGLFQSAWTRQRADWLHGLTCSRLYTLLAQRGGCRSVISVGRVQTPTLALIAQRDLERESFVPKPYWIVVGIFGAENMFKAVWSFPNDLPDLDDMGRLVNEAVAERMVAAMRKAAESGREGIVESFQETQRDESPPLPYSLSALQAAASARFGFTAKRTLDIAQALYETHRLTSYPRTDSRHLPEGLFAEARTVVGPAVLSINEYAPIRNQVDWNRKSKAWNDSKVSDHYAIIPTQEVTAEKVERLSSDEKKIFDLICRSFLMQFMPPAKVLERRVVVRVDDPSSSWRASSRSILQPGWRLLEGARDRFAEDKGDRGQEANDAAADEEAVLGDNVLPALQRGERVRIRGAESLRKMTVPPPPFRDGTLVSAMSAIHRYVTDERLKARLKEVDGIGTEATRAEIIETLIRRGFVERDGKALVTTPLGRALIDVLPRSLKDPGLTAIWESALSEIATGSIHERDFMAKLSENLRKHVDEAKTKHPGGIMLPFSGNDSSARAKKVRRTMEGGSLRMSEDRQAVSRKRRRSSGAASWRSPS